MSAQSRARAVEHPGRREPFTKIAVVALVVIAFVAYGLGVYFFDRFLARMFEGGGLNFPQDEADWSLLASASSAVGGIALALGFLLIAASLFRRVPGVLPSRAARGTGLGLSVAAGTLMIASGAWRIASPQLPRMEIGIRGMYLVSGVLGLGLPFLLLGLALVALPWGRAPEGVPLGPPVPAPPGTSGEWRNP